MNKIKQAALQEMIYQILLDVFGHNCMFESDYKRIDKAVKKIMKLTDKLI